MLLKRILRNKYKKIVKYDELLMLQIVFEATRGKSYSGDIALDDIKYTPGRCGEKIYLQDFESLLNSLIC